MNDLNNISEYQKIIFANGLDESNINYTGGIEALSKKYPFVIFVTKQSNKSGIESGDSYEIDNIWFEGIRLTRFVGIDQSHNALTVGDHTLNLKFDPITGLIGLYDENELGSLSIESITWGEGNIAVQPSQTTISSFNNKFSIVFKYVLKETSDTKADIENINKALSYVPLEYFDKISEENVEKTSKTQQTYKFTYKIKKPYNTSYQNFAFTSNYANDKSCSTQLKLYLHPESYNITLKDSDNNYVISNGSTYNLEGDKVYSLSLDFNPLVDSNQTYHQLYTELTVNEPFHIDQLQKEIKNGVVNYTLYTPIVDPNSEIGTTLGIRVKFVIPNNSNYDNDNYYPSLEKNLIINVKGEITDKFFYFGYFDPRLDTTQLIDCSTVDIGNYIWKDSEIGNTQHEDSWYANKYFYCAIPIAYPEVLPRWGGYYHETIDEADCVDNGTINHSNPLDCTDWFTVENTRYTRNGIDFKIYKRKVQGKFYGFVK